MQIKLPIIYHIDHLVIMVSGSDKENEEAVFCVDVFDKDTREYLGHAADDDYYRALGLAMERFVLDSIRREQ